MLVSQAFFGGGERYRARNGSLDLSVHCFLTPGPSTSWIFLPSPIASLASTPLLIPGVVGSLAEG